MKKWIFFTSLFLFLTIEKATAGPRVGNGGAGWHCSIYGNTSWIQTLDLYEAVHEFHLTPLEFHDMDFDQIIGDRADRLEEIEEHTNYDFNRYLEEARTSFNLVEMSQLIDIDDSVVRVTPDQSTCENGIISKVQIANMTMDGRLLINKKYWDMLAEKEKAALIFHEAYYKLFRDLYKDKDSSRARKVVGYIFSRLETHELKKKITSSRENLFTLVDMSPLANILINSNFNDFINLNLVNYCKKMQCSEGTSFDFKGVVTEGVQDKGTYKMHTFRFTYGIDNIAKICLFDVDYTALTGRPENYISRISFNCN